MRQTGCAFLGIIFISLLAGCQHRQEMSTAPAHFVVPSALPSGIADVDGTAPSQDTYLPELTDTSTLQDYLVYAAFNNPGLEAAFNRWKATTEQIPQATALPDPRFTYRYYIEQVETRVGAQKQAFGISQMFPWFGKLELKGDAATQAANAARQQYEAVKLKLFYQVKDAYYEYYYLWRAIGIVQENLELLKNLEEVIRVRYEVAAAKHPDMIRAQVELGKLEDRLKTLTDLQQPIAARLNAVLNRPPQTFIARPAQIQEENILLTDEQILATMAKSNPELAALRYEIAKNRTAVNLAQKEYYPDVTLGIDFIDTSDSISPTPPSDSGQDPVIAMVSLNLPIWKDKLDAELRQARYQYNAAVHTQTEKLNMLNAQLKLALYQFRDAERKINLYHDTLLPKAIESVKTNEESFRAGGATFLEVIDTQRVMLEFELAYERALSGKAQRLAELEMLVGTELPCAENVELPENPSASADN